MTFLSRLTSSGVASAILHDGAGLASDTPLASDNDNPAAPKTGTAFLARLAREASFARDM